MALLVSTFPSITPDEFSERSGSKKKKKEKKEESQTETDLGCVQVLWSQEQADQCAQSRFAQMLWVPLVGAGTTPHI